MVLVADTSFLIDLQHGKNGAPEYLGRNPDADLMITPITYAEYAIGEPDEDVIETSFMRYPRAELSYETAKVYARLARELRSRGAMIGTNDLWIAAVALTCNLPVVTRNVREFSRVPNLAVESY